MPEIKYQDKRDSGYLYGTLSDSVAQIDTVYVYPNERNLGLGSSLIAAFLGYCKDNGDIQRIIADILPEKNTPIETLQHFYGIHGFQREIGTNIMWREP